MLVLFLITLTSAAEEARLLRFPAIHDGKIVFTYAGDLYTVSADGGVARKITSHDGYEMFARFSPDGSKIAFTGQYDGNTEVFVMPAEGGVPKRLTYTATLGRDDVADRMGPNNIVMAWKHDNNTIVFRSRMREFNSFKGHLFSVTLDGDIPQQLPLPRGGFCSFSPDDSKMAYNRIFREFRTWKRYRGGMADDVWIYDFKTKKTENITNNPAQDIIPMWAGNKIYFLSDRDENKNMNVYVYDLTTKETKKVTDFAEFDVKFPSLGKKYIVFENGGYIYKLDLATDRYEKVSIQLAEDFASGRGGIVSLADKVATYDISPDGKRALFSARGEIFTVPAKHGPTRNLTQSTAVHDRNPKWSPDGKWIAFLSDKSGEFEIYIVPQDGTGAAQQLTSGADTYKYHLLWSPDSKKIAWCDKKNRIRYVDVQTKKVTDVATNPDWEMRDFSWSPDSKWIAYSKTKQVGMDVIFIYSLDQKKSFPVTDGWFEAGSPVFSQDGKYLFFVSSRDFNPVYSRTEWNHAYLDMSRPYLVTLAKETDSPFKPKSDEVTIKSDDEESKGDEKKEEKKEKEEVVVKVDPDGLSQRVVGLPVTVSSYRSLRPVGDKLYYVRRGFGDEKAKMFFYDLSEQKETEVGEVGGYEVSADGKKMIVGQNRAYYIVDLPKGKLDLKEGLDLAGMEMVLDRHQEWAQIFDETWRHMRDFLYAPNMHGVDWAAEKKKFQPLLKYVNHRNDLTYILGEMVGNLNVGHAYVGGGERPEPKRIKTGLLGAELERDKDSRTYRIAKILKGQNWTKSVRSPLTEIGVDANEGDYIIAVDGVPTSKMDNIYQALLNKVDKQVTLTVNSKPAPEGARDVVVVPVGDEHDLYYYNWVQNNITKVEKATDGKVGYIHIPDMGAGGLNEFVKYYYPQLNKKALIIDVRGNGGGNVSPMIIERLRREVAMIDIARNSVPNVDPGGMINGPKVCLLDEFSASDGDIFPYRFKHHKLGKLIGKRSWGGVVGIRGSLPLLDGGFVMKPEFSRYDVDGQKWIMEGHGVDPDIVVDNDPAKEYEGIDQQLNKAIEVILEELKSWKTELPPPPPYPVK